MRQILEQRSGLSPEKIDTLCAFGRALLEKNQVMNLTAITEPQAVAELHFLDSIALLQAVDFQNQRVIDIGCGAGFPGGPLKIAEPSMELTLLDSLAKRMHWLEEYVRTCRESYDIVASRAVARLNVLAELCLPYAKVGGVFLAMKGALADEEIDEARRGIAQLGGSIERVYEYPIQDAVHKAVVIRKQKPTPPKYPRAFAKIKKSPL